LRDIVNALLLREGKILLARRSRARKAYPNLWSFPGGHVEKGETFEAALMREAKEEIDIVPLEYELVTHITGENTRLNPATFHLYAVRSWQGHPTIVDLEHTELQWFTLADAAAIPDLALEAYRPLFGTLA
jgi:8-oxo-dGTP diphosphatase